MAGRIKVAVSPFYAGTEWVDKYTGIKFERNTNGMNVYSIPADANMTGIDDAIRLNALILMEGEIDPKWNDNEIEEPGRWTKTEVIRPEAPGAPETPGESESPVDEGTGDPETPEDPEEDTGEEGPADPEDEGEMGAMAAESFSIEGKNSDELKAYAEKNNITVEGSGKGGNVVKKDLEQAITAYQAEQNK